MGTRFSGLITAILVATVFGSLMGIAHATRIYLAFDVPDKEHMLNTLATGTTFHDRYGNEFFSIGTPGRRTNVAYDQISPHVTQALVAAEDRTFFTHHGISPTGIARAAYKDIKAMKLLYGGSTITQQLTKTILLNPRKSLTRKYWEAIYAIKIDQVYSKEDILHMYLNNAYFGEQAYGIEAAAQTYFKKSAAELTVAESALLIGVLPAPTALSPISGNTELAYQRQRYVLNQMAQEGFITSDQASAMQEQTLTLAESQPATNTFAHHFALAVHSQLLQAFTKEYVGRAGMHVYTTLDPDWQKIAEEELAAHVENIRLTKGGNNGAVVAIDVPTREVRALVGSVNWNNDVFGKMNMATSPRQTGSAFKPIAYAAAFESRRITPASILIDQKTTFGEDYSPENYDKRYRGGVTTRYALANSLNVPAVAVVDQIGPRAVASMASRFGVSTLSQYAASNLSIALGTEEISLLELTNAYGVFADKGYYKPPRLIVRIEDKFGESVNWGDDQKERILREETAFLISSILSDNTIRRGTFGSTLVTKHPSASKTGTNQDFRDAWTVGYNPNIAVGVWIGNNDFTPMKNAPGATTSAPVWRSLINQFTDSYPSTAFAPPQTIVQRYICPRHGLLSSKESGGVPEYFIRGTEPSRPCPTPIPEPEEEEPKEGEEDAKSEDADKKEELVELAAVKKKSLSNPEPEVKAADKEET